MLLFFKWILLLFVFVLPAEAAKLYTYPEPRVTWDTSSGKIIHRSVCDNYTKGSLQYRACRKRAKLVFKGKCKKYKMKYDTSNSRNRKKTKPLKEMYCYSARNFRILNN
jgi:hypothetical protein